MLAALDRQAKQAAALAAEAEAGADGKQVLLRLGQRVVHKEQGFRGVVVGWDVGCCESEEWQERAAAEQLKGGLRCAVWWWGFLGCWYASLQHAEQLCFFSCVVVVGCCALWPVCIIVMCCGWKCRRLQLGLIDWCALLQCAQQL